MKECSSSLALREIQVKTTLSYHLTPVRMAKINKTGNDMCWRGCGERGTLLHCWWECKLVQTLWRTVWRFLKKLKIELPYDSAIALLGIYPNVGGYSMVGIEDQTRPWLVSPSKSRHPDKVKDGKVEWHWVKGLCYVPCARLRDFPHTHPTEGNSVVRVMNS